MELEDRYLDILAALARIDLAPAERSALPGQLESILAYVGALGDVSPAREVGVTPPRPTPTGALRPDSLVPSLPREALLQGAPRTDGETILVPHTLEPV